MVEFLKRTAQWVAFGAASAALSGCLITNFSATQSGGLTHATATVTLQGPAPCTVDAANGATNCKPLMQIGTPPLGRAYQFDITLLNWTTPLALYDPVIVQVPASMSDFAGSIAAGPPGVTPGTPLQIQSGLTSIAIDANTTLTAEPGMQFVIIDFVAPANAPSGQYTLDFQFRGTASAIKVIFAGKVTSGAATYYPPIFPCATNMSQVPAIPIPTSISAVLTTLLNLQGCVGRQYNLAAPATLDLNQNGLSGSWYNPATDGQGIELEFFASAVAPDTAYVQGAWFTFDTGTTGGADRQRWYTFAGNAKAGEPSVAVKIYRNTGGNFVAPPTTSAVEVGTGTLSMTSCSAGTFSYAFNDGTGRTGSVPLTRLTQNVTCATSGTPPVNADFGYSGNWFDPATSGQGLVIELNPASRVLFLTWYTYAPSGQASGAAGQRWFTAQSDVYTPGARTVPVTIYQTTGGLFDQPTTPKPQSAAVGTGTVTFTSCTAVSFAYNFTGGGFAGRAGTQSLVRVGPTPPGCGP
jgi:hypothetical protein